MGREGRKPTTDGHRWTRIWEGLWTGAVACPPVAGPGAVCLFDSLAQRAGRQKNIPIRVYLCPSVVKKNRFFENGLFWLKIAIFGPNWLRGRRERPIFPQFNALRKAAKSVIVAMIWNYDN